MERVIGWNDGRLLIEHGFDQRNMLSDFAVSKGLVVLEQIDDLSGLPRFGIGKEKFFKTREAWVHMEASDFKKMQSPIIR
ncbi:MAG: hypothetical protein CM15mP58_07660 [Burkholderiaceae bacterium]|nr:MAG: hypothetical protein CM15mP58_07660 [Burkholderiaceae bacterium]